MTAYLDNAATTMVCPEAAQAALRVMTEVYGNPSSTHTMGRDAKAVLDSARKDVAAALGSAPDELYFTSGGTESDNWAILSGAESMKRRGRHVISSAAEHDAVRRSLDELEKRGFEVTRLMPEPDGSISPAAVDAALREDTVLVSLMLVNNETGAVTDISAVSALLRRAGSAALLHTDAVQGFLKLKFSAPALGAHMISISGHKIHAPKGAGALYIKSGLRLPPLIYGGSQERGYRAGTEGLPQIAAFGQAALIGYRDMAESMARMKLLRDTAVKKIAAELPGAVFIADGLPHIFSLSLPGYKSEVLMNYLESKEIYVSKSSACKKGGRSHVLEAIGLKNDVIDGALRVSFSRFTDEAEALYFCDSLRQAHQSLFKALR